MTSAVFSTSSASNRPEIRVSPTARRPGLRRDARSTCRRDHSCSRQGTAGTRGKVTWGLRNTHKAPLTAGEKWQTAPLTKPTSCGKIDLGQGGSGVKRVCPNCTTRFYDLQKRPIECPKCQFSFEPEALYKQRRPRQPEPVAPQPVAEEEDDENEDAEAEETEADDEVEEEVVVDEAPLIVPGDDDEEEEVVEAEEEDAGMTVVDADAEPDIADIEVEDDEDDDADDGLLEEEEDEDDVSDIIDADIEKDDR